MLLLQRSLYPLVGKHCIRLCFTALSDISQYPYLRLSYDRLVVKSFPSWKGKIWRGISAFSSASDYYSLYYGQVISQRKSLRITLGSINGSIFSFSFHLASLHDCISRRVCQWSLVMSWRRCAHLSTLLHGILYLQNKPKKLCDFPNSNQNQKVQKDKNGTHLKSTDNCARKIWITRNVLRWSCKFSVKPFKLYLIIETSSSIRRAHDDSVAQLTF